MELKLNIKQQVQQVQQSSNRTFMELKHYEVNNPASYNLF